MGYVISNPLVRVLCVKLCTFEYYLRSCISVWEFDGPNLAPISLRFLCGDYSLSLCVGALNYLEWHWNTRIGLTSQNCIRLLVHLRWWCHRVSVRLSVVTLRWIGLLLTGCLYTLGWGYAQRNPLCTLVSTIPNIWFRSEPQSTCVYDGCLKLYIITAHLNRTQWRKYALLVSHTCI